MPSMDLKLDQSQTYDRVSGRYLRLMLNNKSLIHYGMNIQMVHWIMVCLSPISFDPLINGAASTFIVTLRGLRQGCLCHPFSFSWWQRISATQFKLVRRKNI